MVISGICAPVGAAFLLMLDKDANNSKQIGCQIVIGVSIGLQFQASLLSAQLEVPKDVEGSLIMITVFMSFLKSLGVLWVWLLPNLYTIILWWLISKIT